MNKKILFILLCVFTFNLGFISDSQSDSDICNPDTINEQINEAIAEYNVAQGNVTDVDEAIELATNLQNKIDEIINKCPTTTATATPSPTSTPTRRANNQGNGTLNSPFAFNNLSRGGPGYNIAARGFIRPATNIIMGQNMFNERAETDEEYVIVTVEISCYQTTSTRNCEPQHWDFQLVGDNGIIYDVELVVYDDFLEINILPGRTAQGNLPFIVKKDDENFKLIFNEWLGDGPILYYLAEPSLDNGLTINSNQTINVRSGPGQNFDVSNRLEANTSTIAFGRNTDATWLQISTGWVFADLVTIDGDKNTLPITSQ